MIPAEERAEKFQQKAAMVVITGLKDSGKKPLARTLEKRLFEEGHLVYFLGISNILYGVDADIKIPGANHREEHLRRLAEVAHVMLDAGALLIVTATGVTSEELEMIQTVVTPDRLVLIWIGPQCPQDLKIDLEIPLPSNTSQAVASIRQHLLEKGILL
jgi:bifunctional enzyme CysN/CysC